MAKWPFGNEDNPFADWEDEDRGTVQDVINVHAGFRADVITGGMIMDFRGGRVVSSAVGGEIRTDGQPRRCTECDGTRGWKISNGVTIHTGCGAVQR